MLHEAGRICRQRPAFWGTEIELGYGELDLMVSATAQLLELAGIKARERVALFLENGWAYATLLHALIRMGAVPVLINTRLPVLGVRQQLDQVQARTLIARVSPASQAALGGITCLDPDGLVSRTLTAGHDPDTYRVPIDQTAAILFTSGSSGTPKAAALSYGNFYYSAVGVNQNVRLRSEDCWLLSLPLYHVGGLGILFRCLQTGAAVALPDRGEPVEAALARFPVTHLSLVPAQLKRLLQATVAREVIARLKAVIVGGSAVSARLVDEALAQGWPVLRSYGLTEMNAQVTAVSPHDPAPYRQTSGRVLPHRELQILADDEIAVRGQTLFQGYVDGDQLRRPLTADGWFATGDLGELSENGYLVVTGRKDRLFISGGENIQPEEVEQALLTVAGVSRAWVRPQADAEYGQRPIAFVDRSPELDDATLRDRLRQMLPAFKVPVAFQPWPDHEPDSDLGKWRPDDFRA